MKTGNCSLSYYYALNDPEALYKRHKELGYDTMDENLEDCSMPFYKSDEAMVEYCLKRKEAAEKYGVEIFQVHGSYGPWSCYEDKDDTEKEIIEVHRRGLLGCKTMGSKHYVIHPVTTAGWRHDYDNATATEMTMRILRKLVPICEDMKIIVCLENLPGSGSGYTINTVEGVLNAVKEINSDYIKICLDTGHASVQDRDVSKYVYMCGDMIRCLHVHDTNGHQDIHILPYQGVINWDKFTTALADTGFSGSVSSEVDTSKAEYMPDGILNDYERLCFKIMKNLADETERKKARG